MYAKLLLSALLANLCACAPSLSSGRSTSLEERERGSLEIETIPHSLYAGALFSWTGEYAQILFHLNFYYRGSRPTRIRRLSLLSHREGNVILRLIFEESALARRLRPMPWITMQDRQTLAAAHRWRGSLTRVKGDTRIAPGERFSLTHQFAVLRPEELPDQISCVVEYDGGRSEHRFPVNRYRQSTPLRLPFSGKWWVMAGHGFDEDHGQAVINSQNFAYDVVVLDSNRSTFAGDARGNESYHAHGQPIVAAATGEVVEVSDGLSENTPVGSRPSWQQILRSPQDLGGNFVVLRHTDREYTAYLHLRPGLTVKKGMTVSAGQVIGTCGNSGNSLESHLHFQLQDGPDLLRANGLPARFSDFTLYYGHLRFYVPAEASVPLPVRLVLEPGHMEGAAPLPAQLLR